MNITLDRFKYFLEVAKLQHVGLASKSLNISPSAISNAITAIEEEYGCSLFERNNQRIFLNEKGEWLKEELSPLIEQIDSISQKINGKTSLLRGHLNVGGSIFLANHSLHDVLHQIQKKHAEVSIEISPLRSTQVMGEILNSNLDYGICISPGGHPHLEKHVLYKGLLKIVVSKTHPLAKKIQNKTFKYTLLNDFPAAIHKYTPGIDYQESYAFEKIGVTPNIRNFYHSEDLAIKSVLSSNLWAVVPDIVFKHYKTKLVSITLPKDWEASYEICSLYRKSMKGREIFNRLDQMLMEKFKN